jgi:hypothetical protein
MSAVVIQKKVIGIGKISSLEVTMLFAALLLRDRVDVRRAWGSRNSIHICTLEGGWIGRDQHI